MNDFQIIYGWLQLDKPTAAFDYLARRREQLENQGEMLRHAPPVFGLSALELELRLRTLGVEVEYGIGPLSEADYLPRSLQEGAYLRELTQLIVTVCEALTGSDLEPRVVLSLSLPDQATPTAGDKWLLSAAAVCESESPELRQIWAELKASPSVKSVVDRLSQRELASVEFAVNHLEWRVFLVLPADEQDSEWSRGKNDVC
jgi:hypothetical protein